MTNVNFDHELALGILRDFLVGLSGVKTNWAEHCFWRLVNFLLALGLPAKDMLQRVLHFTVKRVLLYLAVQIDENRFLRLLSDSK